MAKKVVVLASGETERRSLPHLVAHLKAEDITLAEVRIPPGRKALTVEMAEKLLKASWFGSLPAPPDKFVVLVDTDGKGRDEVLRPFQEQLPGRIGPKIHAQLQFACAQWHLEAWYFADNSGLRDYLKRELGVDASKPDEIRNPKPETAPGSSVGPAGLYGRGFRRDRKELECRDHQPAKSKLPRIP